MGFADSFKKIGGNIFGGGSSSKDVIGSIASKKGLLTASGTQSLFTSLNFVSGREGSFRDTARQFGRENVQHGMSASFGAHLLSAETTRQLGRKALGRKDRTSPPPVAPPPGQGADTTEAKLEARRAARKRASSRFGFQQTIATSPLGVSGEGATLGRKKLLGE